MGTSQPLQPMDISSLYQHRLDLDQLASPFTTHEAQRAVLQLAPNKASGPDGLPNEFFKQNWDVLQPHIMPILHRFASEQLDLSPINEAHIVFLPKIDAPNLVTDYRPISLINLLPKVLSKILANRIKPFMTALVTEYQTAFVQGRFIAENFLTTREVLHHVHQQRSPALLLKLDFTKAFDTLDWPFLFNVMTTRGFPQKFINWISHLLSTSTSRLQINGCLSPPFPHKRGLRQGDPISPYLFILAVDVLQQMTNSLSALVPYSLSDRLRQPVLTFQYADDTMIMVSVRGDTLRKLLLIMHCFSAVSGLEVNFSKSLFVPLSIPDQHLNAIEQLLGCKREALPITYLGMPLSIKKLRRDDFMPILQKLEKRLEGWKARFLSRAGKLQLVKSVLSSIPTYFMSCFALPNWLILRIDRIRRQFLWSRIQNSNPIHLLNWGSVCLPITNGGLGVPNLQLQNTSLLLRWWWRLYESEPKLWCTFATLLYAKRTTDTGPLLFSSKGSFFWRSLIKLKPIFHSSVFHRIESGHQTSFWHDAWAGQPLASSKAGPTARGAISVHQAKRIFHQLIPAPFTVQQHHAYEKIRFLTFTTGVDKVIWRLSSSGNFSVKSIYKILSQGGKTISPSGSIWKAKVTPSMALSFFFLIHSRLLTQDNLLRRNISHNQTGCIMCMQTSLEDHMHLFFLCPFATHIWNDLAAALGYTVLKVRDSPLSTFLASAPASKERFRSWIVAFITATSLIWRERNARIFRNKSTSHSILLHRILQDFALYLTNC